MRETKQCAKCKALLPIECYGSDLSQRDRLERRCRKCISEKNRQAYRRRKGALGASYQRRGKPETMASSSAY